MMALLCPADPHGLGTLKVACSAGSHAWAGRVPVTDTRVRAATTAASNLRKAEIPP
jgi:hypothetical protein